MEGAPGGPVERMTPVTVAMRTAIISVMMTMRMRNHKEMEVTMQVIAKSKKKMKRRISWLITFMAKKRPRVQ